MSMTSYLRNSLVDSELYTSEFKKIADNSRRVDIEDIKNGEIPEEITDFLYENACVDGEEAIDVLINPVVLFKRRKKHGERDKQPIAPLWMPARLNNQGQLHVKTNDLPWLARNYLFPAPGDISSIGYLEDFNDFLRANPLHVETWNAYWKYAASMFNAVTGYDFDRYEHDDYTIAKESFISVREQSLGNKEELVKVYNDLLERNEKELPQLYKSYISLTDTKKDSILEDVQSASLSTRHSGQFNQQFPVTESQRETLHHFFTIENGEILAVNGPPGTGKSAQPQIIMASLWVEAALREDQPPLILGSTIDNFTAVDMAEDFSAAGMEENVLTSRWLPDIESYGLYLASPDIQEADHSNLPVLYPNQPSRFQQRIESPEYIKKAKEHYLQSFYEYTGTRPSAIEEAASHLHGELKESTNAMKEVLTARKRLLELEQEYENSEERMARDHEEWKLCHDILEQWYNRYNLNSHEEFLSHLDTTIRYRLFKLATHYWEARWLMEMKDWKETGEELNDREEIMNKWHRYAKITPFFVSTLFTVPAFFASGQEKDRPLYEAIDLLVIDEAGQVLPEVAGPAFSLAKKALAVGDDKQVEPLWNITETFDLANMKKHGLFSTEKEKEKVLESGLAASNGSVLRIAQRASRYQVHPAVGGMFLTEHRRSVPEIIAYCNELSYNGWLEPKRPPLEEYPFPHIGYMDIQGDARRHSASISNQIEAEAIVDWIISHRNSLDELYQGQSPAEVVGVVTPFTQQKRLIEKLLEEKELGEVTVGTIHAIQGAECRIMIFSPVHDVHTKPPYFFDRNETLLNVAVSRAQDSFLVFGDKRLFDQSSENPSGLLARYLFTDKANEII